MDVETFDYEALQAEVDALPYGYTFTSAMSPGLRAYVQERHRLGVLELDRRGVQPNPYGHPMRSGFSALLGSWWMHRNRKVESSMDTRRVYMATLKNDQGTGKLLRLENAAASLGEPSSVQQA